MNKSCQVVIEDIGSFYPIPIPLMEIAKDEGICVIFDDYGTNTFDGMTWYEAEQDMFYMHINTARHNAENNTKGRFTLAHELGVSIRRMPYCVPRKCFVPLHHDFKFFKLWYKARNN